jgi:hypothetical protein
MRFALTLFEIAMDEGLVRTLIGILRTLATTASQPAGNNQAQQKRST